MADRSTEEMYASWVGHTAYDPEGNKLGTIQDIYFDDESNQPEWITVKTGLFGKKANFAPLEGARTTDSGEDLVVGYSQDQVKDAPKVDVDGTLTADEEKRLYEHYGRPFGGQGSDRSGDRREPDRGREADRDRDLDRGADATRGAEAGTAREATGTSGTGLRLRKYTVTEERTITVPVTREEVRLERDPDADPEADRESGG